MRGLEELLNESSSIHGHHCAGQVLGVRMAMVGCREVAIDEPKGCKKLVVYVEIDRCATDAVQTVTGCSLGKRTLKFLDYGKMAVTFINTETQQAVRVVAKDEAREQTLCYAPDAPNQREAQKQAYRLMPEEMLFTIKPVAVSVPIQERPNYRSKRVPCKSCGEEINFHRDVEIEGYSFCIPCARGAMLPSNNGLAEIQTAPKVLLIVGYKKVGKTSLIEKLIAELADRGYRVGTVKHHHSSLPVSFDSAGSDTWRHRQAGATDVVLATPTSLVTIREHLSSPSLNQILSTLGQTDIVLVEGFHKEPLPKIEVISDRYAETLCRHDANLFAIVGRAGDATVPAFDSYNVKPLANFIEQKMLRHEGY